MPPFLLKEMHCFSLSAINKIVSFLFDFEIFVVNKMILILSKILDGWN